MKTTETVLIVLASVLIITNIVVIKNLHDVKAEIQQPVADIQDIVTKLKGWFNQ